MYKIPQFCITYSNANLASILFPSKNILTCRPESKCEFRLRSEKSTPVTPRKTVLTEIPSEVLRPREQIKRIKQSKEREHQMQEDLEVHLVDDDTPLMACVSIHDILQILLDARGEVALTLGLAKWEDQINSSEMNVRNWRNEERRARGKGLNQATLVIGIDEFLHGEPAFHDIDLGS